MTKKFNPAEFYARAIEKSLGAIFDKLSADGYRPTDMSDSFLEVKIHIIVYYNEICNAQDYPLARRFPLGLVSTGNTSLKGYNTVDLVEKDASTIIDKITQIMEKTGVDAESFLGKYIGCLYLLHEYKYYEYLCLLLRLLG